MAGGRQTPIPDSIEKFYLDLGKAILMEQLLDANPHIEMVPLWKRVQTVAMPQHQATGRDWARTKRQQLLVVADVARTAERAPDPYQAMLLLTARPQWAEFIQRVRPVRFGAILTAGANQQGEPLIKFLRLLQELATA